MEKVNWKFRYDSMKRYAKRLEKTNDRLEKHLDTCLRILLKYPQAAKKKKPSKEKSNG